jgi:hypothetical protein
MRVPFFPAVLLSALIASGPDGEKPITRKGVVTKVEWIDAFLSECAG